MPQVISHHRNSNKRQCDETKPPFPEFGHVLPSQSYYPLRTIHILSSIEKTGERSPPVYYTLLKRKRKTDVAHTLPQIVPTHGLNNTPRKEKNHDTLCNTNRNQSGLTGAASIHGNDARHSKQPHEQKDDCYTAHTQASPSKRFNHDFFTGTSLCFSKV